MLHESRLVEPVLLSLDADETHGLQAVLHQANQLDPVEKTASFGRWWLEQASGQIVLSLVAADYLSVGSGPHANLGKCFEHVMPEDMLVLVGAIKRLRQHGKAIDCLFRVLSEHDGIRWLRMVSLPTNRQEAGILPGMLLDVTAPRQAAMRERLGFESTQFLVGSHSLSDAIQNVIRSVCENLGWDWGAYWDFEESQDGRQHLVCRHYWHNPGMLLDSFERASRALRVAPGTGLVGYVWETGRAKWADSIGEGTDCLRQNSVIECGLKSGYAFPVSYVDADGQRHTPGVLEFCSSLPRQREAQLPNLSMAIGALVAQAVQRIEQTEIIRRMAQTDAMTGLMNRSFFYQRVGEACATSNKDGLPFAVLYIDLDRFKPINDAYGHDAGNVVLLEFAKRMTELADADCQVGRIGGDEFAMLVRPVSSLDRLDALALDILVAARRPYYFGAVELTVSASIGISMYPENGQTTAELMRSADAAMYRSKNDGRNSHCFCPVVTPAAQSAIQQQVTLEVALHHALMDNEFYLDYQPIFDSFGHNVVAVEALIRWQRSNGEMVRPDVFIPIAERSRLIVQIGRWVLRQACGDLAKFHRAGLPGLQVNVNMAATEFARSALPGELMTIVEESGIRPQNVCLELTEGMVMQHADRAIPIMKTLRRRGFRIGIDDFGMGHSSLSRLKELPITSLKIDRSFVRGLPEDKGDCSIVRTIFSLGTHMNLRVIAEGVETDAQLGFLQQFGYPMMQGFLLARPMSAEMLIARYAIPCARQA